MPNPAVAGGLQPLAYASGGPYNGAVQVYYVPSSNTTALFLGDPVAPIGDSADANGVPAVQIATAGASNYILGSFQGIANNAGELVIPVVQNSPVYLPAGQAAYVYVADDPNLVFSVEENGSMAAGAGFGNVNLVAGAGSTYSGYSGWQLNSSSLAATATLQMRILRALQRTDLSVGQNNRWLCRINLHSLTDTTGVV